MSSEDDVPIFSSSSITRAVLETFDFAVYLYVTDMTFEVGILLATSIEVRLEENCVERR